MRALEDLVAESHAIVDESIRLHVTGEGKELAGVVILFSGGNDSTVLAHLMRGRATLAAHANTTIGVEQTREFVRATCATWGLPLREVTPPNPQDHYRALVLAHGFPGPGQHFKSYQRLKERSLRVVRGELVPNPRTHRVVFLAGRRREESQRRTGIPEMEREGSTVWASPLAHWSKLDLNRYRVAHRDDDPVPLNEVSQLIHMSGECLCGSFAKPQEREEILDWFPRAFDLVSELEEAIRDRDDIPEERRRWGWGAHRSKGHAKSGRLCSSCAVR